jgi:hypothetical protein
MCTVWKRPLETRFLNRVWMDAPQALVSRGLETGHTLWNQGLESHSSGTVRARHNHTSRCQTTTNHDERRRCARHSSAHSHTYLIIVVTYHAPLIASRGADRRARSQCTGKLDSGKRETVTAKAIFEAKGFWHSRGGDRTLILMDTVLSPYPITPRSVLRNDGIARHFQKIQMISK